MANRSSLSRTLTVLLFLSSSLSWAQEAKLDCMDSTTQRDLNICADKAARSAQARLNSLLKKIRTANTDDKEFLAALDESQKAWGQYRDAQMKLRFPKKDKQAEYGSVFPMCAAQEGESLTEKRISELRQWVVGDKEGNVCVGSLPVHSE